MEVISFDLSFGAGGGGFGSGFGSGFGGSDWVSVTEDVRTIQTPVLEYGIRSSSPDNRIADIGTLSFAMNNGAWNSAGTLGYYSPLHAMARGGFDFNIPVRLTFTYLAADYYKFFGKLGNIAVEPGAHENRLVYCTAMDLFDDWSRMPVPALDAQFDKRGDELLQTLLDILPDDLQPPLRAIETGLETHPTAFDNLREESMTIYQAMNDICLSDQSKLLIIGSTADPGGLLVSRNRHNSVLNPTVMLAFDNDMARGGLVVPGSRDDLVSSVQVFVHPTHVDADPTTVLYDLQTTQTYIAPGQTNDSIFGPYRDPANTSDRTGGTDMQPLESTIDHVDYLMNTEEDGTGTDLTASFTATASYTGSGVDFTLTNNGLVGGYVIKLQCRGKGIYRFTAVLNADVDTAYGQRVMSIDMPFQNSVNVGTAVAEYYAEILSRPFARVSSVTFLANLSPTFMDAAMNLEPGHRVSITEDVTGLDEEEFVINGVRMELHPAKASPLLWVTYYLEPADMQRYWLAGVVGASEVGLTTVAAY